MIEKLKRFFAYLLTNGFVKAHLAKSIQKNSYSTLSPLLFSTRVATNGYVLDNLSGTYWIRQGFRERTTELAGCFDYNVLIVEKCVQKRYENSDACKHHSSGRHLYIFIKGHLSLLQSASWYETLYLIGRRFSISKEPGVLNHEPFVTPERVNALLIR